jgi:hypothetical protein
MMEREAVCYTREVALEKAIEMEAKGFEAYKEGYLKAEDPRAKDLLRPFLRKRSHFMRPGTGRAPA